MCQIEVIIRLKETEGQQVIRETELSTHSFDLLDIGTIPREERVDRMEEAIMREGWQIMRQLYLKQWQIIEQKQLEDLMSDKGGEPIRLDGKESLKIFSRLGKLELPRQVCFEQATEAHIQCHSEYFF